MDPGPATAEAPAINPAVAAPALPLFPPPAPDDALRVYLASRDAPCWGCGYNLRGVHDAACPECGRPIELAISRPGIGRGAVLFMVLALCWVVVASVLGLARSGMMAHQEATANGFNWVITTTGGTRISGQTIQPGQQALVIPPPQITLRQRLGVAPTGQSWNVTASRITLNTPPPGTLAWSRVRWETWTKLGWWAGLLLAAAVGLLIVLIRRRALALRGPGRRLAAMAAGVFVLCAAGQTFFMIRDLM